jgi:hypothetical protein
MKDVTEEQLDAAGIISINCAAAAALTSQKLTTFRYPPAYS